MSDFAYYASWILGWILAISAVIYLVAAGITYERRPSHDVWYSTQDYLKASGLDVNKTYHLRLGSSTGGGSVGSFSHSTTTDFFLFAGTTTSTESGQILPSSTLRLGFRTQGNSYILEIPYSKVQFKPEADAQDSVKFIINDYWEGHQTKRNVGANFWRFGRGHPSREPTSLYNTARWNRVVAMGLPIYLSERLSRVVFTLTPQQYSAYLGTLQPTGKK